MNKPFGGQYIDDAEGELMFGELPEKEFGGADESEIDANNDETFGAEIIGGGDELEDYAAQTACLRLEDNWDKSGFHVDAPDPSQLPIPDFGMNLFDKDLVNLKFNKLERIWNDQSSLMDLWDSNKQEKSSFSLLTPSGINNPEFASPSWDFNKTDLTSPFGEFPINATKVSMESKKDMTKKKGFHRTPSPPARENRYPLTQHSDLNIPMMPGVPGGPIPSIPSTALSAEELEKNFVRNDSQKERSSATDHSKSSPLPNQQLPSGALPPALIPQLQALQAQFNLSAQAQAQIFHQMQAQLHNASRTPSEKSQQPQISHLPPGFPPHFNRGLVGQYPSMNSTGYSQQPFLQPEFPPIPRDLRQYVIHWYNQLIGKTKFLPPNVPPIHPMILHKLHQCKDPKIVAMMLLRAANIPPQHLEQMSYMPHGRTSNYRRAGMPSERTIEDLALDKFAGFMSCKERQWLERIQGLQCQGNGNPYEEDYYYICWRQKRNVLAKININKPREKKSPEHEENGKNRRIKENRSEKEEKIPLNVKFAGSLGLPSKCTTSNPRHLISVSIPDNNDDENESNKLQSGAQRKLRSLLLRLEAALALVIQINDRRIAMQHDPTIKDDVVKEIDDAVQLIYADLLRDDLPKVLQINKGKLLFSRLVQVCFPPNLGLLLSSIFNNNVALTKSQSDEASCVLINGIHRAVSRLETSDILVVLSSIAVESLSEVLGNNHNFCWDIFLSLVFSMSLRRADLDSPIVKWFRSDSNSAKYSSTSWDNICKKWFSKFKISMEHIVLMREWIVFCVRDLKSTSNGALLAKSIHKCTE
ncbi:unnamed protein product [Auanema sp. JU1783]|nr:unnamed protein product [Auanema sp. JU1783]